MDINSRTKLGGELKQKTGKGDKSMSAAVIVGKVENLKNITIALFSTSSLHFSLPQLSQVMCPQHRLLEA